jgi:uncharacterized membrane-anchored protein YhcB (DUF1043 family)
LSWLFALIGLALGSLAGYLLARHFGDSAQRATALEKELERARTEHAEYRREVSDHFAKTAVAVNQLTDSYRNVHQQLSDGARALCDNAAAETALAFDQSRLIDAPASESSAQTEPAQPEATSSDTAEDDSVEPRSADTPDPKEADHAGEASAAAVEDEVQAAETAGVTASDPAERGGASWTPATPAADSEPVTPPRDYADEDVNGAGAASKR